MNMIMHGEGHGGVYYHNDGLLNVNEIFENRFDIIFTNPPFGTRVERTTKKKINIQIKPKLKNIKNAMVKPIQMLSTKSTTILGKNY